MLPDPRDAGIHLVLLAVGGHEDVEGAEVLGLLLQRFLDQFASPRDVLAGVLQHRALHQQFGGADHFESGFHRLFGFGGAAEPHQRHVAFQQDCQGFALGFRRLIEYGGIGKRAAR